ncbi:hypothetical protein P3342_004277 [Pyrenophora teres f. teres]|nr:hypothetical protein P3342_004277 [Pyrenophora teres f. teres]
MDFRCKRCEEKNLRCFVETTTGRCAGCISVWADCSLFVSEEEWKQVQLERERKELEVAQAEERQALAAAEASRLRRELLQVKSRERAFARRDLAILDFQEKATQQAEGSTALVRTFLPSNHRYPNLRLIWAGYRLSVTFLILLLIAPSSSGI